FYLVAVGASPGPRAVVLHRAVPAGFRTRRCRNGVAHGERERERQSNLAQHDQSPHVEARSDFYGLDRRAPRLFPGPHSNGVRSAQVFVRWWGVRFTSASVVSCNPTSRLIWVPGFLDLRRKLSETRPRGTPLP